MSTDETYEEQRDRLQNRYGMSSRNARKSLNYHGPKTIAEAKLDGTYRWSRTILRALRSRYVPHIGQKQLTKQNKRHAQTTSAHLY